MTGIAGEPSGVIRRCHLRKAFGFGAVGLMTAGAHYGCVQLLRLHRTRIVGVLGQGAVASLASDHHMFAQLFLIHDVGMAGFAGFVPGKCNWPGCDLADRRPSIVAILPKTVRDDGGPQNYECHQPDGDDGGQPNEVFDVLEQARVPRALLPGTIRAQNGAMSFDTQDSSRER
jgi:hypothetical protein